MTFRILLIASIVERKMGSGEVMEHSLVGCWNAVALYEVVDADNSPPAIVKTLVLEEITVAEVARTAPDNTAGTNTTGVSSAAGAATSRIVVRAAGTLADTTGTGTVIVPRSSPPAALIAAAAAAASAVTTVAGVSIACATRAAASTVLLTAGNAADTTGGATATTVAGVFPTGNATRTAAVRPFSAA